MPLLYFIFACYGMTQILVYGTIFDRIRPKEGFFGKLLSCPLCTGFWVGIFNWFFLDVECGILTAACISSGTSYILCSVFTDYGINFISNKDNK